MRSSTVTIDDLATLYITQFLAENPQYLKHIKDKKVRSELYALIYKINKDIERITGLPLIQRYFE